MCSENQNQSSVDFSVLLISPLIFITFILISLSLTWVRSIDHWLWNLPSFLIFTLRAIMYVYPLKHFFVSHKSWYVVFLLSLSSLHFLNFLFLLNLCVCVWGGGNLWVFKSMLPNFQTFGSFFSHYYCHFIN